MMFDVLEKRIGDEVVCSEWFFGSPMTHEGVLEEVVPFDKVVISKTIIPFVGERQAIESIVLKGKGKTVYSNTKATNYDRKLEEVALAQEEMLGYSILLFDHFQKTSIKPRLRYCLDAFETLY